MYYNISKRTVPLKDLWMKTSITWILFIEKSCFDYYLVYFLDYILSVQGFPQWKTRHSKERTE